MAIKLKPIINGVRPVVVGIDLGLTPAAVIGQQDPRGQSLFWMKLYHLIWAYKDSSAPFCARC